MNDANNHNYELPKPSKGVEIYSPVSIDNEVQNEKQIDDHNQPSSKDSQSSPNPKPSIQIADSTQQVVATQPPAQITSAIPVTAQDLDVMEKEWVNRAKQVVNATRDNPRQQNIELAKVKADYLQKRFQKTLKIDDEKK